MMSFIKLLVVSLIIVVIAASFASQAKKKKIVFFGDSITEAGAQPSGFISIMRSTLQQKGLGDGYDLIGAGIGGNKVYDLYLRMDDDVLSKKPDIVVIWVGVNDVWHKRSFGTGTDADKFAKFYTAIIRKLQAQNIQVFMCTPAAIGEKTDFTNELDGDLNKYAVIIRDLAKENNCQLIDLRKAFLDYNLKNNPNNEESGILTVDRVHLNDKGNNFVAEKMMEAIVGK
jgi:lysophospholipase L1-like esterase